MADSKLPGQGELFPSFVQEMDRSGGMLDFTIADLSDIDPDRHITLAHLTRSLGKLAGPIPKGNRLQYDPVLGVTGADLRRVEPITIEDGLYIYRDDPRYSNAQQTVKTTAFAGVRLAIAEGIKLPFDLLLPQPGIVVSPEEFVLIARNPKSLVDTAQAGVRKAQRDNPNWADVNRKAGSASAKIMKSYETNLLGLEGEFIDTRKMLTSLLRQTRGSDPGRRTPQNQYKAKNLDLKRREADERFHYTLEISAINNGLGQTALKAAKRALSAKLHRHRTDREGDLFWREQIVLEGQYTNAKRFKVLQSLIACRHLIAMYERYEKGADEVAAAS
jgi:hypothetical protein